MCEECGGDGVVLVSRMDVVSGERRSRTIKAPGTCPACRGSGSVERPRSTAGETADD